MESADNSKHDKADSLGDLPFAEDEVGGLQTSASGKRMPLMSTEELHDGGKKTKKSMEQIQKRYRYDLLHAFFRVYFIEEKDAAVEKDAIMLIYQKKMPAEHQIARNALFRRLWAFYGTRIHIFQSNYRELIKGLRIRFNDQGLSYDGVLKDLEELRNAGFTDFWSVKEDDLLFLQDNLKKAAASHQQQLSHAASAESRSLIALGISGGALELVAAQLEQLEATAKQMLSTVGEIRAKLKVYDEEKNNQNSNA